MNLEITPELEKQAEEIISHYPASQRSASLPLLHLFQEHFGYVAPAAITWIAAKLALPPINVLELVTFYPMFRQKPAGKHHIRVCRTLSCAMAGGEQLMETLCQKAGIHRHEHAGHGDPISVGDDGKFSIEFVECLASCGTGPVMMVNDDFFEGVAETRVPQILEGYEG